MKSKKRVFALMLCVFTILSLVGCSSSDTEVKKAEPQNTSGTTIDKSVAKQIDNNIAVPEFVSALTESKVITADTAYVLDGTANSPDGGEITYQWYTNNVNSNSGGTVIAGAVGPTYQVDTSEVGTKYYYVVATNTHDSACNMTTGNVAKVEVRQAGTFTADEYGGIRLLSEDGSYPTNVLMRVVDADYYFDANGYIMSGWVFLDSYGTYLYFDESGKLQPNSETPDGYHTDANDCIAEQINPYESQSQ